MADAVRWSGACNRCGTIFDRERRGEHPCIWGRCNGTAMLNKPLPDPLKPCNAGNSL